MGNATGRIRLNAPALLDGRRARRARDRVRLDVGTTSSLRLPRIGLEAGGALSPGAEALAMELLPSHVGLDANLAALDGDVVLEEWVAFARRTGIPLELRLEIPPEAIDVRRVLGTLAGLGRALGRVILVGSGTGLPPAGLFEGVRRGLQAGPRGQQVALGTRGPFAIVNREWARLADADAVAFGVNPMVHADDDLTVLENLEALPDLVRTARVTGRKARVHVSPITLTAAGAAEEGGQPGEAREASPFGAAWTLASVASLAWARATSATYHGLRGAHAVVARGEAGLEPGAIDLVTAPTAALFAALGALRAGRLVRLRATGDHPVAALAVESRSRRHMLLCNLGSTACEVTVDGLTGAAVAPLASFRARAAGTGADERRTARPRVRLELGPYDTAAVSEGRR